jgi:hypothetical protein
MTEPEKEKLVQTIASILLVGGGMFFLGSAIQGQRSSNWAGQKCGLGPCFHPEWLGVGAALIFAAYLVYVGRLSILDITEGRRRGIVTSSNVEKPAPLPQIVWQSDLERDFYATLKARGVSPDLFEELLLVTREYPHLYSDPGYADDMVAEFGAPSKGNAAR